MDFKNWLNKTVDIPLDGWFHGTRSGDGLRKGPIQVSTSGGGQRGLQGFWLTRNRETADRYSNTTRPGTPEIIEFTLSPNLKIANLFAAETEDDPDRSRWLFVGLDIDKDEDAKVIRSSQPYALTKLLMQQGYHGALIPNTLSIPNDPELVLFDPKHAIISARPV